MNEYEDLYNQSYGDINNETPNLDNFDVSSFQNNNQDNNYDSLYNQPETSFETPSYNNSAPASNDTPKGLDPDLVALMKGVRYWESGNKAVLPGEGSALGDKSIYQYTRETWKEVAGKYLGSSNAPLTRENENKATYMRYKDWKDQGKSAAQIASMHNAGIGRPNAYKENHRGTNDWGVKYDTPAYVKKVMAKSKEFLPVTTTAYASTNDISSYPEIPESSNEKSFSGFGKNVISSGGNFLGSLANAVMNPIDTVTTLGKLGLGAIDNVTQAQDRGIKSFLGDNVVGNTTADFVNKINPISFLSSAIRKGGEVTGLYDADNSNALADAVGESYVNRYGGVDNIIDTAYNDPVGVLADVATVLSGGAGAATKVGKLATFGNTSGKLAKIGSFADDAGNIMSKAAKAVDPLTYVVKAGKVANNSKAGQFVKDLPTQILGVTTGEGAGTFKQIYDAAKNNRPGAINAMRGGVSSDDMISKLDDAVYAVRAEGTKAWNDLNLNKSDKTLDISSIGKEVDNQLDNFNIGKNVDGTLDFSRSKIRFDTRSQSRVNQIFDEMKNFGLTKADRTPFGVDNLKQSLGTLFDDSSQVKSFVQAVKSKTRSVLSEVDGYNEYTKKYGDVQDTLTQLKKEMSAGNANASQTWRKIVNTFKQRNTEGRQNILLDLQEKGISDLIDNIAGYGTKDFIKSSLMSNLGAGGAIFTGNPLALPAFSPRIVGETVNFLGKTVRTNKKILNKAKDNKAAGVIKYLGGQVYNKNNLTRSATIVERSQEGQEEDQE